MKIYRLLFCFCLLTLSARAGRFALTDSVFSKGSSLVTYRIMFDFQKASIRPDSRSFLDTIVVFLKQHDSLKIEIANHTDQRSNPYASSRLSKARANAIRDYLVQKGIAPDRLTAVGYEGTKPLIPEAAIKRMKTREAQEYAYQKNRRTEFIIR